MQNVFNFSQLTRSARRLPVALFSLLLLLTLSPLSAQNRFSLEIRGGANFATRDLGDADLGTGFGIGGSLAYRFMPHLSVYTGWDWNRFSADESFEGTNIDFEETGYMLGLRFIHPLGSSNLSYLVGAGGTYNHIEAENSDGDIIDDTGHGLGWQADAGLVIPIGNRWQVIPGIRYRALSREFKTDAAATPVDLNYFSGGVGFSWSF